MYVTWPDALEVQCQRIVVTFRLQTNEQLLKLTVALRDFILEMNMFFLSVLWSFGFNYVLLLTFKAEGQHNKAPCRA